MRKQMGAACPTGMECPVCADWQGVMPYCGPLANPYVPYQLEGGRRYETNVALARGTIFEGLDLPYRGIVNQPKKNMSAMEKLQGLGFAITELGLYLDTHRLDKEATELFNTYVEMYEQAQQQLEQSGVVLTQMQSAQSGKYEWLNDPWPWEYREEG